MSKNAYFIISLPNFQDDDDDDVIAAPTFIPTPASVAPTQPTKKRKSAAEIKHDKLMKADKNFGGWQKHTKGFGAKLLSKVGCYAFK